MAEPWEADQIVTPATAAPWAADPVVQSAATGATETKPAPTVAQAGARGLGLGVRDVVEGATALPGMALDALTYPGRALNRLLNIPTTAPSDLIHAGVDATGLPQPETTGERMSSAAIRGAASTIPTMGLGAVPAAARAAPAVAGALTAAVPSQIVGGAASGAASQGAAELGAPPIVQTVAGLLAGVAAASAPNLAGRVVSPIRPNLTPESERLIGVAGQEGIPLSAGQQMGSRPLKTLESTLAQLPGSSGGEVRAIEEQSRGFNRAVLSRAGIAEDVATPDVLNTARARIGQGIGDVANRNTLAVTPQLDQRIAQIEDSLRFLPAEAAGPVRARIEQLRGMMIQPQQGSGGVPHIPGASYRMLDSALGRSIRSTTNGDLRSALGDIREELRTSMDASISPQDAAEWHQLRRQYANLMVIADAVGGAGSQAAEGNISPLALRTALNRSTGRGYAFGRGDLNDLARIGQNLLRPLPDSFTAQRNYMMRALTGTGAGAGAGAFLGGPVGAMAGATMPVVAPAVIGAAMRSGPGQWWLTNQLGANIGMTPRAALLAATEAQLARNRLAPQD